MALPCLTINLLGFGDPWIVREHAVSQLVLFREDTSPAGSGSRLDASTGEQRSAGQRRKEAPQAIRLEPCSIFPRIAGAGPRGFTFEVGSDTWGLNPLGDPQGSLAHHGESAAPR